MAFKWIFKGKKVWQEFHFIIHQPIHLLKTLLNLTYFLFFSMWIVLEMKTIFVNSLLAWKTPRRKICYLQMCSSLWLSQSDTSCILPCVVDCGHLHNEESMLGFCKHFMSESLGQRYGLGGRPSSQWLPDSCTELAGPHRC